jgi:hypothetical protein
VAWRTVPTFVAGVLATVAGAVVVWCRGPGRTDSAVTDRLVRWWASVWLRAAGARVVVALFCMAWSGGLIPRWPGRVLGVS